MGGCFGAGLYRGISAQNTVQYLASGDRFVLNDLRKHFCSLRAWQVICAFGADLLDRSATPKGSASGPDFVAMIVATIACVASVLESLQKIALNAFGLSNALLAPVLVLAGMTLCVLIVAAKSHRERPEGVVLQSAREYSFVQSARQLAKASLLILIVTLPTVALAALEKSQPLPPTIYGYVIDSGSSVPVANANVRVVDPDGADSTGEHWPTDARGFYIVHTIRNVNRGSVLKIQASGCATGDTAPLTRAFETRTDPSGNRLPDEVRPVFKHYISGCGIK
jgi:hypothetical protein